MWASVYYSVTVTCVNLGVFKICVCACLCTCVTLCTCGSWRTTCESYFSPSIMWVPLVRTSGKCLYPWAISLASKQFKLEMNFLGRVRQMATHFHCLAAQWPLTWLCPGYGLVALCVCVCGQNRPILTLRSALWGSEPAFCFTIPVCSFCSLACVLCIYVPFPRENETSFNTLI